MTRYDTTRRGKTRWLRKLNDFWNLAHGLLQLKTVVMAKIKRKEAKQDMFTTTISLCPEVHQRLKHLAVDLRVPFRELIRAAIEGYLAHCEEKEGSRS
jgi:predicted DNA-binding protein